jgi:hypothetical protein
MELARILDTGNAGSEFSHFRLGASGSLPAEVFRGKEPGQEEYPIQRTWVLQFQFWHKLMD